jgi:hypothetical protein
MAFCEFRRATLSLGLRLRGKLAETLQSQRALRRSLERPPGGRAYCVSRFQLDVVCSLASVSRAAVRLDEACGFAALLTWIRIFDKLK